MCTLKQYNHRKSDSMNNQVQSYTRPKRDIKPQLNLFYESYAIILIIKWIYLTSNGLHTSGYPIEDQMLTV